MKARKAEQHKARIAKYGEGPLAASAAQPSETKPEIVAEEDSFKIDSNLTAKAYSVDFLD